MEKKITNEGVSYYQLTETTKDALVARAQKAYDWQHELNMLVYNVNTGKYVTFLNRKHPNICTSLITATIAIGSNVEDVANALINGTEIEGKDGNAVATYRIDFLEGVFLEKEMPNGRKTTDTYYRTIEQAARNLGINRNDIDALLRGNDKSHQIELEGQEGKHFLTRCWTISDRSYKASVNKLLKNVEVVK